MKALFFGTLVLASSASFAADNQLVRSALEQVRQAQDALTNAERALRDSLRQQAPSCRLFNSPRVNGKVVFSRGASPQQFCIENGYPGTAVVKGVDSTSGVGAIWNGRVWEDNTGLEFMTAVECCR